MSFVLVTGGARSGKSRFAEARLAELAAPPWIYFATAEAGDDEMRVRIDRHRARRGAGWRTVEAPRALAAAVTREFSDGSAGEIADGSAREFSDKSAHEISGGRAGEIHDGSAGKISEGSACLNFSGARGGVVDCITLWLSNRLFDGATDDELLADADALAVALAAAPAPLVVVTNEVGDGIVPEHALGRRFRDLAGLVNQRLARAAGEVVLVVSGLPLRLR